MSESYAVSEKRELLLERVRKFILDNGGIVKKSQLAGLGIDYRRILDFVEKGDILRVKSGYYAVHLSDFTEEELVAKLFPDCVLNLEMRYMRMAISKRNRTAGGLRWIRILPNHVLKWIIRRSFRCMQSRILWSLE